jgi:hypothetical protein
VASGKSGSGGAGVGVLWQDVAIKISQTTLNKESQKALTCFFIVLKFSP